MKRSAQPTSLAHCIGIRHGFAFQSEYFGPQGQYLLLTPGNFYEDGGFRDLGQAQKRFSGQVPAGYVLRKGDVLVAMTEQSPGLLGATIRIPEGDTYLHNQRLGLIEVRRPELIAIEYVYHLFNSPHFRKEISATASGTKVKHTSPDKLCEVFVSLPSIPEQRQVAVILDDWDVAIEDIDHLIQVKEQLYKQELSRIFRGAHHPRTHIGAFSREVSERNRQQIARVLSVTNTRGFVLPEEQFERRVASDDLSNYKVVRRGQYAYNPSRINVGSIARLDAWDTGVLSPMYVVFELDKAKVASDYFAHWLASHEARQRIKNSAQGSVRETVSYGEFAAIHFPLPDKRRQLSVAAYLSCLSDEVALLKRQAEKLRQQRRGLMQKLLTGDWCVTVSEEAIV